MQAQSIRGQKVVLDFLSTPTLARLLTLSSPEQVMEIRESLKPEERLEVSERLAADGFEEAAKIALG